MEALVCKKLGDPTISPDSSENSPFTFSKSHPIPKLITPTSVRVRVKCNCINYANYLQILGKYQEKNDLPFIVGSDYSGVVESVGSNVTEFKIGDPVCSFSFSGSFAQFLVAEENELCGVPDGCDLVDAAAIPIAYGTSHQALVHRTNIKSGQNWTINGFYLWNSEVNKPGATKDSLKELLSWLARGLIKVTISNSYKLE